MKLIRPLNVEANDYDFTAEEGWVIGQDQFRKKFAAVLRILNIRPLPFYNTRHTHISVSLTIGSNPKWVAEQNGTSLAMIQTNYGRYIRTDGDRLLQQYVGEREAVTQAVTSAA